MMEKALEKKLKEKYPEILSEMWGDPKKTCMAWGIECDDGWFSILDEMLSQLDFAAKKFTTAGEKTAVRAAQIKEKFGTLSFYYDLESSSEQIRGIVRSIVSAGERASASVCEVTGKPGTMCVRGGWMKTLSREIAGEMGYEPTKPEMKKYWEEMQSSSPAVSTPSENK